MRDVTLSGGVLDGLTFTVADDTEAIVHHAAHGGVYVVSGDLGAWTPAELNVEPSQAADLGGLEEFLPKTLTGLIAHARIGRVVLIVGKTLDQATALFDEVAEAASDDDRVETIARSNGAELIRFQGGGRISTASPRSLRSRGLAADVLFLAAGVSDLEPDVLAPVMVSLAASNVGLVIHEEDDRGEA